MKKFNSILAAVLAFSLAFGVLSCKNGSGNDDELPIANGGGNTHENPANGNTQNQPNEENGDNGQKPEQKPQEPTPPKEDDDKEDDDDKNKTTYPQTVTQDLQNEVYIFDRHRFVDKDENWGKYSNEEKGKRGNILYNHAKDFMAEKIADLKNDVATLDDSNDFQRRFKEIINEIPADGGFNGAGHLKPVILGASAESAYTYKGNNDQFAKYFALFKYQLNDIIDQNKLVLGYNYLGSRSYNDSLGNLQNSSSLPTNSEFNNLKNDLNYYAEIENGNINDQYIENTFQSLLQNITNQTGVARKTLEKAVNLALYNEGLFGAFNLTGYEGIQSSDTYSINARGCSTDEMRTRSIFNEYISLYYSGLQNTQNRQYTQTNQMGMGM